MGLVVPPYLVSRAVDSLDAGRRGAVIWWSVGLLVAGVVLAGLGIWRHRTMTQVRMDAALRTVTAVTDQALRLGVKLKEGAQVGEVMTIGVGDVWTIGRSLTVTGPGVGAVLTYLIIAVLLFHVSALLAAVVLAGVPLLVLILGPTLGRLQNVGTSYRAQQGGLTGRIVDIIGGLHVLNGFGGKGLYASRFRQESQELQDQGYRVGRVTSVIQAAGLGLPTLFMAVVVWLAARLTVEGSITVGELVAVYGYAAVLVVPVASFIESAVDINRALVAGRRVTDFLALSRDDDRGTAQAPSDGDLIDTVSGFRAPAGTFAVIATARQSDATTLVDRLGGLRTGATWNGQPIHEINPTVLRRHLVIADNDADLFPGSLAGVVSGRLDVDERDVLRALHTAAAADLVQAMPDGLASRVDSGGRNLSGGQRQRVRLARASLPDPRLLLASDPTSAVDAATEAAIVERLVSARRGRTTVVTSTSALMLAAADQVYLMGVGGSVIASGTHARMMREEPAYSALVFRGETPENPTTEGRGPL